MVVVEGKTREREREGDGRETRKEEVSQRVSEEARKAESGSPEASAAAVRCHGLRMHVRTCVLTGNDQRASVRWWNAWKDGVTVIHHHMGRFSIGLPPWV
jgi:hypothetical protein